ncbi:MAG: alkene reductase, partial [Planctomycetota bacterium]
MTDLLDTAALGPLQLPNRLVMAPLTRNRADADRAPHELNATYYAQRATAGLIISEATQVTPMGIGYPGTPGIHSEKQKAGWKLVTDAVHQAGGRMFAQLWFCGRQSHSSLLPDNATPVSASAIKPGGQVMTAQGTQVDYETPRSLEANELPGLVEDYRHAAKVAKEAGFDGVEIHAANGYLLDQFLRSGSNQRDDEFGGSA